MRDVIAQLGHARQADRALAVPECIDAAWAPCAHAETA
jgi:hypothetical protein